MTAALVSWFWSALPWVWLLFAVAPLLLLLLYTVGIQYEGGAWLWWALLPVVLVAALLDVLLNWTVFILYLRDIPKRQLSEYTLSQRLARLVARGGCIGALCLWLALALNTLCPSGVHVVLPKRG